MQLLSPFLVTYHQDMRTRRLADIEYMRVSDRAPCPLRLNRPSNKLNDPDRFQSGWTATKSNTAVNPVETEEAPLSAPTAPALLPKEQGFLVTPTTSLPPSE